MARILDKVGADTQLGKKTTPSFYYDSNINAVSLGDTLAGDSVSTQIVGNDFADKTGTETSLADLTRGSLTAWNDSMYTWNDTSATWNGYKL